MSTLLVENRPTAMTALSDLTLKGGDHHVAADHEDTSQGAVHLFKVSYI
jgi:hypothetical protein